MAQPVKKKIIEKQRKKHLTYNKMSDMLLHESRGADFISSSSDMTGMVEGL